MIRLKQASSEKLLPLGLGLIGLVLAGSLWACIGFVSEWAAIEVGLPEEVAHHFFRSIAFGTSGLTCAASIWLLYRLPTWRKQAAIGFSLYLTLLLVTPRWFTYDTGLYHVPFINHLNEIGLEWNLGLLHSRYSFFNLLLYGQAAISRLAGTVALPSLNGLILTSLLLLLINEAKGNWKSLTPCLIVSGALLLPTESTEGFHSYNADFALGCIFLSCCLLITSKDSDVRLTPYLLGVTAFMPALKISGIILIPPIIYGLIKRWGFHNAARFASRIFVLFTAIALTTGSVGYISSGYLFYPVSSTGPLRDGSISKEATINESKVSTIGWARFAYSGQLKELKAGASPHEWMPQWAKSSNGKKMLGYLCLSIATTIASFQLSRLQRWKPILIITSILWGIAIFYLPPDPRFYIGLALTNLYCGSVWLANPDIFGMRNARSVSKALIALIALMIVLPSTWRPSGYRYGEFPEAKGAASSKFSASRYVPRGKRVVIDSDEGTCWDLPAPCKP